MPDIAFGILFAFVIIMGAEKGPDKNCFKQTKNIHIMAKTGTIGVTTDNIFPVIKKFLYSDNEIFLRELVSNAVDATQKLKTLSSFGDFKGELGDMAVTVAIDKENGTLTVSDKGIGMTADDIEKYINQIAFSGAEEFLEKYKDNANSIIGHFGLGFYSAFMVAKKVVINTLSYKEGAQAVRWECDGSPAYTIEDSDKTARGTDIILYIDEENKEFLEQARIESLLKKYCRFLPVPVVFGKKQEWKDGKMVDTDEPNVVNITEPAWTRKPSELTDENYREFYRELFPGKEDPLFHIHLNVDYPFNLTGILFFPKIRNNFEVAKNRIQLYCNQVFVTDSVEGVVPEFMMLLEGVIDSPDIPLNVSRSYLQSDSAVKKISGYITRKVASRLEELFKADRKQFEEKWNDIKIFIEYGMLTDEKFCDAALKFYLLQTVDGKFYTIDEYKELIAPTQTDKEGKLTFIYATDKAKQVNYIDGAVQKGLSVLLFDDPLAQHLPGMLEMKVEGSRFVRVDSEAPSRLVNAPDDVKNELKQSDSDALSGVFKTALPEVENATFTVSVEALGADEAPVSIIQNEFSRRFSEMTEMNPAMAQFGAMGRQYNMVVNASNKAILSLLDGINTGIEKDIKPVNDEIAANNGKITSLRKDAKDASAPSPEVDRLVRENDDLRKKLDGIYKSFAESNETISQLVDLALLSAGLLSGSNLSRFVARSFSIIEK